MSDTITFVVLLVLGILAINVAVWSVVLFFLRRRTRQISAQWAAQGLGLPQRTGDGDLSRPRQRSDPGAR